MSRCTRPLYAMDLGLKENGARNLKILPRRVDLYSQKQLEERYGKGSIIALPCGSCLACRENHAKEWAVRCVLEGLYHDENWFLTLTYDDNNLPSDKMLHRKDLQDFVKRLRHHCGKVRYFGCGEYGTKNERPHYHLILFGLHLPDLKAIGNGLYESKLMSEIWPYGFHYLGSVSYASCAYVAGYATKKFFNAVHGKNEWICFSTHPGLGAQWFKDHYNVSIDYDCVISDFGSKKCAPIPRYFDKMAKLLDEARYVEMKAHRIDKSYAEVLNKMLIHGTSNIEEMLEYEENAQINDYVAGRKGQRL